MNTALTYALVTAACALGIIFTFAAVAVMA
ncbi:hypothetical protein SAMN05444724_0997 [Salinivibrio sp. ES.052]|nr:hypothetical protein SAMN05444724_0997 [Salinivibrio sp. ES.052]